MHVLDRCRERRADLTRPVRCTIQHLHLQQLPRVERFLDRLHDTGGDAVLADVRDRLQRVRQRFEVGALASRQGCHVHSDQRSMNFAIVCSCMLLVPS
jgi:hypothetical protein